MNNRANGENIGFVLTYLIFLTLPFRLINFQVEYAQATFVASLITMLVSLYLSLREIHLSVVSLDIVLSDLENEMNEKQRISEETEKDFTKKYFR